MLTKLWKTIDKVLHPFGRVLVVAVDEKTCNIDRVYIGYIKDFIMK